ncbi:MAG TPA: HAMP domain-containing sensor histidine kinase [Aggregatilineales bacterium]|jgi:signal transduction histidine kinase|nr:HAMP domain-containing sensor histidine kinase [Aggregatilineales bacterium]
MTTQPRFNPKEQDALLSEAVHQLKTPLSAMKLRIDLIMEDEETMERHGENLDSVAGLVDRMQRMINDLLEYARLEAGMEIEQRTCDLRRILNAEMVLFDGLAQESGVTLHVAIDEGPLTVRGDEARLQQVFNNLIENAIKYNQSGGEVWVTLRLQGGQIRFDVKDTGMGIPEVDLPRVFDRFYRARNSARKRGSGLGLAIVRIIVERHGGEVWAVSTPGQGSTFSVTLPALRNGGGVSGLDSGEATDALDDALQDSDDDSDDAQDEEA